jgi:PAS domain S-box-containing protein
VARRSKDKTVGLKLTARNITPHKQIEQALQESEERFKLMMQQSPSVIELYDLDGLQIDVNHAYEVLWGFPASRTVRSFNVLKSKEVEATGLMKYVKRAYKGETVDVPAYRYDSTGATEGKGKGRVRWLNTKIYPLKDIECTVQNIVITHEDITTRMQAINELTESERKYRSMISNLMEGFYSVTLDGIILDHNSEFCRILGESPQKDYRGMESPDLWEDAEARDVYLKTLKTNGFIKNYLVKVKRPDGKALFVQANSQVIKDPHGNPLRIEGTFLDVTDHKLAEKKLRTLAAELTLTEERLRRHIATKLHDTISQSMAMTKMEIDTLCERVSDQPIGKDLNRILQMVSQTLLESRTLTSELSYPLLSVLGFEKTVEKWLEEDAQTKYGLAVSYENDTQLKPLDEDVCAVLFRGVRELLVNVAKHAQANTAHVSIRRDKKQIVVTLKDDGIGCDPEKAMSQGDGFGLLSIYEALNRLDGHLVIKSSPKLGCEAIMTAPIRRG